MEEIALGSLNSKLYEKSDELYYKITPILLQQNNFHFDAPVSKVRVIKNTEDTLILKYGRLKLKMSFKSWTPGLFKLRLTPYYFGCIPFGIHFCEISQSNKERLQYVFTYS